MTSLIVRVKRRRSASPSNQLVVVEDESSQRKKSGLKGLSLGANEATSNNDEERSEVKKPRKLVLRRMGTVKEDSGDRQAIDVSKKRGRAPSMEDGNEGLGDADSERCAKRTPNVFLTRRKRVVRSKKEGEYVVVDLSQIAYTDSSSSMSTIAKSSEKNGKGTNDKKPTLKRTMVLNPPDRHLESALNSLSGIELMRPGGGAVMQADFNSLLTALMQGGNVNLQTRQPKSPTSDSPDAAATGKSALMLACYFGNHRVASRLIARGADVFLADSKGRLAMDYLQEGLKQRNDADVVASAPKGSLQRAPSSPGGLSRGTEDLVLLLNKAASKSAHEREVLANIAAGSDTGPVETGAEEGGDDDYVVDIFAASSSGDALSDVEGYTASASASEQSNDSNSNSGMMPMVAIEGLRIDEASSKVEFVEFDYDSDWSDLGEDEDPDSNDERYHGNDYPEEESDENGNHSDDDDEYDDDSEDEDAHHARGSNLNFRGRPADVGSRRERSAATGHVIRPQVSGVGEDGASSSPLSAAAIGNAGVPTPESIQRVWQMQERGEEEEVITVKEGGGHTLKEHRDRLRALQQQRDNSRGGAGAGALGSQFGSNPHEFGRDALPKYRGLSDSDDDEDDAYGGAGYGYREGWDDSQNDAQFSHYAQDAESNSDEEDDNDSADGGDDGDAAGHSYGGASGVRYGQNENEEVGEEQLLAQARATRAFYYNGLRDEQQPPRQQRGDIFRLQRGVVQKR